MLRGIFSALFLTMVCAPTVHAAGQGTIEETDTAIIAEFTGDAKELPAQQEKPATAAASQRPAPAGISAAPPGEEPQGPAKSDMSVRESRAAMSEAQRQKREVRAAAQAARVERLGGATRQPRAEVGE